MKNTNNIMILLIAASLTVVFASSCSNTGSNSSPLLLLAGGKSQLLPDYKLSNDISISSTIGEVQSNTIVKIPRDTSIEALKAAISVAQGSVFDIYESDGETIATKLTENCTIVVTAEDGTKAVYTLHILLNSDTSLTSSIGEVKNSAIVNIPFGTAIEALKAAISVAEGAAFDIYQADGETIATQLTGNCIVVTTAEDGTKATYTLSILPDPAIMEELIGFNPESPEFTIVNAQTVTGYNGNTEALSFDGDPATLDYAKVPDSDNLTLRNNGTIEVLVKANSFFPYAGIVHKGERSDFSDEAWGIQLWDYDGSPARLLFMVTGDDGNWIGVHGSFNLQPGQWYHIIGTWDESSLRLYVNGVLDGTIANTTGGVRDTNSGLIIGSQLSEIYSGSYGNLGWDGVIDRVIIRNDTVSDEWVLSRYNSL